MSRNPSRTSFNYWHLVYNYPDYLPLFYAGINRVKSKKRKAENQRKFELGGAVLAAFKKLNIDISNETPQQITNRIVNTSNFHNKVRKSLIFKDVKDYKKEYFEANKLFIQVLEGLHTWKKNGEPLTVIEIKNAVEKGQK